MQNIGKGMTVRKKLFPLRFNGIFKLVFFYYVSFTKYSSRWRSGEFTLL